MGTKVQDLSLRGAVGLAVRHVCRTHFDDEQKLLTACKPTIALARKFAEGGSVTVEDVSRRYRRLVELSASTSPARRDIQDRLIAASKLGRATEKASRARRIRNRKKSRNRKKYLTFVSKAYELVDESIRHCKISHSDEELIQNAVDIDFAAIKLVSPRTTEDPIGLPIDFASLGTLFPGELRPSWNSRSAGLDLLDRDEQEIDVGEQLEVSDDESELDVAVVDNSVDYTHNVVMQLNGMEFIRLVPNAVLVGLVAMFALNKAAGYNSLLAFSATTLVYCAFLLPVAFATNQKTE